MDDPETPATLFECGSCGNVGLGRGEMSCCDRPMQPVSVEEPAVARPSLADLLRTVFDMSETELDICLCVMEGGELTVAELAEQTDYDRSVVSRHLGHLVDLGALDRRRRLLERGGHVYVYSPNDAEAVRRSFREAFLGWLQRANALVDELSREKVEAIVETDSPAPQWRIYRE